MPGLLTVLLLFFAASASPAWADAPRQHSFASPKGGYAVVFTELEHKRYGRSEMIEDLSRISNVLYRVEFIPKGAKEASASLNYADVYGWEEGSRPSGAPALFRSFIWSPDESFVMLPEEGWASAPGTPEMKAVALDGSMGWKEARVDLENIRWLDSASFIGDRHNDCDYGVARFDGQRGTVVPIKDSESPIGYELLSVEGRSVKIRMLLDNCRMQDVPPRCFRLDLSTLEEESVPCPRERGGKKAF